MKHGWCFSARKSSFLLVSFLSVLLGGEEKRLEPRKVSPPERDNKPRAGVSSQQVGFLMSWLLLHNEPSQDSGLSGINLLLYTQIL